jgi:tetratricopeptide (TPR) repeat protein
MKLTSVLLASSALLLGACALPVETLRATAYSEIARAQMAAGDPDGARETAQLAVATTENMEDQNERAFGIPAVAVAQIRAGDLDGAQLTADLADDDEGRVAAYTALTLALMESGHTEAAKETATQALEAAQRLEPGRKRDDMLVNAAWAQAITGDVADARALVGGFTREKHRNGLLGLIAMTQLNTGDIAGATATAHNISIQGGQSDSDAWIFSLVFNGIARDSLSVLESMMFESKIPLKAVVAMRIGAAQFRSGDSDAARQSFLAAMQYAGTASWVRDRIRGVSNIALARAGVGDLSGAVESISYAEQLATAPVPEDGDGASGEDLDYVRTMRKVIGGNGSPDDLSGTIDGADPDSIELLVAAAMAGKQLGRAKAAAVYLEAAVDSLPSAGDLSMVAAAYGVLADTLYRQSDRAAGRAAAKRTLEIADSISVESEDRAIGLFFAAVALAGTGDTTLALETAEGIQKPVRP